MSSEVILDRESAVQKLIELATMHLSLRECHGLAVAALKNPDLTTRIMNLRFIGQRMSEAEMVELLRGLRRDIETAGDA